MVDGFVYITALKPEVACPEKFCFDVFDPTLVSIPYSNHAVVGEYVRRRIPFNFAEYAPTFVAMLVIAFDPLLFCELLYAYDPPVT